jgi:hypothetical protein
VVRVSIFAHYQFGACTATAQNRQWLSEQHHSSSTAGNLPFTVQKLQTSIPVTNAAVAGSSDPCESLPPDEDDEFVNQNKARNKCCLQERWSCHAQGHTYCFSTLNEAHIPLKEEAIEAWVSSLVRSISL